MKMLSLDDAIKAVTMLLDYEDDTDLIWSCDVINNLQNAPSVTDVEPTQKWISVKDRLPTYAELRDDHVLVMFDDGTICSTGFDECIEGESIFGEWRQNFDMETLGATDSYWKHFEGVTHWMRLPEPPKEENDAPD